MKFRQMLRHVWWKVRGWPDLPPQQYCITKQKYNRYTGKPTYPKWQVYTDEWLYGDSIEEIAKRHNVTRERIRQCIWKAYRDHHRSLNGDN